MHYIFFEPFAPTQTPFECFGKFQEYEVTSPDASILSAALQASNEARFHRGAPTTFHR